MDGLGRMGYDRIPDPEGSSPSRVRRVPYWDKGPSSSSERLGPYKRIDQTCKYIEDNGSQI